MLFNANIAFLAIPNLLPQSGINAAATASLVSITLSLSSVIFGQLLSKKLLALREYETTTVVSVIPANLWCIYSNLLNFRLSTSWNGAAQRVACRNLHSCTASLTL